MTYYLVIKLILFWKLIKPLILLQVLYNLFTSKPEQNVLNATINASLIDALISETGASTSTGSLVMVPNCNDRDTSKVWIAVVSVALENYFK